MTIVQTCLFPAELQRQVSATKSRAVAAEQAAAEASAQLASAQAQLEKSNQRAAALVAAEQRLKAELRQAEERHQQAIDRLAAEAAHRDAAMAALQLERDSLLADQQQLVQAVAEQQAALSAQPPEQDQAGKQHAATPKAATPPASSSGPPSLDVIRLLRDQKEALQAQHEATVEVRVASRVRPPWRAVPDVCAGWIAGWLHWCTALLTCCSLSQRWCAASKNNNPEGLVCVPARLCTARPPLLPLLPTMAPSRA